MNDAADKSGLHIKLDMNVLNHLGIGLYSNTPAVLTEIIANGWDADAKELCIDIKDKENEIVIRDDGIGMDHESLQDKFLTVGYARRERGEEMTPGGRQCMGRKGIGKLAMFSLAEEIHLVSKVEGGDYEGFIIKVDGLKAEIEKGCPYYPIPIVDFSSYDIFPKGTLIILKKLNKRVNKTETFLRQRIARRFSVIGDKYDFKVKVNGKDVKISDRGFYESVQLLWTFGNQEDEVKKLCKKHQKHEHFEGKIDSSYRVNGFIGGVEQPKQLLTNGDNNNTITLIANGRIFDEDVQKRIDDSKVFNSYLVGELQVDFFDENGEPDMAISSRQGVQEDDPRFNSFLAYLKTRLEDIGKQWDVWRREIGGKDVPEDFPIVKEWLDTLNPRHQAKASQLVGRVNTMRFSGNKKARRDQRRGVLKHMILAFEHLQLKDNINAIDSIDVEKNAGEFAQVLLSIEDIEATMHHDLVSQKLAVVKKLDEQVSQKVRERVVQDHIYNHLWLVDSSWEYKDNPTDFELKLTEHLKKACPDTEEGARLDIGYRTTAGKYIVLELKKPGLTVQIDKLISQGTKYATALKEYFHSNPGSCPVHGKVPIIEVIFIVNKRPNIPSYSEEHYDGVLKNLNAVITTYEDLINRAMSSYEDYLASNRKIGKLRDILKSLEDD